MKIGLFGRKYDMSMQSSMQLLIEALENHCIEIKILESFYSLIFNHIQFKTVPTLLSKEKLQTNEVDFLFSIGGDGTLLNTVELIQESNVPVLGVNMGHLGFLTSINPRNIKGFVSELMNSRYTIEKHSLLHVETTQELFGEHNFALNEVSIHRENNASLLSTNVYINNEILATYTGDGLVVATPTGSTAYSLSCGGPILTPDSNCFVITPIAAHTLTLRPLIIPDSSHIRLVTCNKEQQMYMGRDSQTQLLNCNTEILLSKEKFSINLIRMQNQSFYRVIQEKLMWGVNCVSVL